MPYGRLRAALKMEIFIEAFPHIAKQIFEELDNKSLATCKQVSKSWKKFIVPIQIARPKFFENGDTYLHLASKNRQIDFFKDIFEIAVSKNPKNDFGVTPLHIASERGLVEIVEFIIENSVESNVNLNSLDYNWNASFHVACRNNQIQGVNKRMAPYLICHFYYIFLEIS